MDVHGVVQVVNCFTAKPNTDQGCQGGEITDAFDFIAQYGLVPEDVYPCAVFFFGPQYSVDETTFAVVSGSFSPYVSSSIHLL